LEHVLFFPSYWECHHPNGLSYFSEGWLNHQVFIFCKRNGGIFAKHAAETDVPLAGAYLVPSRSNPPTYKVVTPHLLVGQTAH